MINLKDIKKNFLINYYKYWIVFIIILIIFLVNVYRHYHFKTDQITGGIENAVYVGSGVAINKNNIIINKSLLENTCFGKRSKTMGKIFLIDKKNTFQAILVQSSSILNIAVLSTKKNEDKLNSYALFDINNQDYVVDDEIIVPRSLNKGGYFNFEKGTVVDIINSNFLISVNNTANKNALFGMPIFNNNYILLGVVKTLDDNFLNKNNTNILFRKSNVQKIYVVNGVETIKNFLDSINVSYSMISGNFDFGNKKYNTEDSMVDVVCIKAY